MTVRELYNYANANSLLDKEINEVIAIFNVNNCVSSDDSPKTSSTQCSRLDDLLSKKEWSIEDVLWLFSSL